MKLMSIHFPILCLLLLSGCATDELGFDHAGVGARNYSSSGSMLITSSNGSQKVVSSHDARVGPMIAKSNQVSILGIFNFGDSMADAVHQAGINQITTVERNTSASI